MADSDLMQLYSRRILALTTAIPHQGRLDAPDGSAMRRSPQCGSSVTVDVVVQNGRIADFAQQVRACALGQASAAVLGSAVIGRDRDQICAARDQLRAMLKDDGPAPAAPFADLEALLPAREYPNRHASILLAWDATLEALDQALAAA
ncbi:iron-sulfur cluster assembly scaffold protein [Paracoccus sp. R12_1]|uniref:iron-sulfur cluster assembly scaffold protein n=1 Tax=unclassified Paracoccus (in: a-proteobacteria) TaxID=2688777 RepID=UPI000C0B1E78|nr:MULTISPECIES: iron-sulfur cluster assembly scaffold protein [unclassified Paracoccus (in: a-proteobacteria)]MBO9454350.1 iron-sulfur cluster assembly scaffold protein [Paracoccus sp. R12_2]MBO9485136.1 iron-sulfur cluster assembly scaffold protein [Paracoccus sp. R12_1]PHQ68766.1 MAG: iron-sulfur cluster assembly scaffold protein [Paracoccus sp. (in: a-proteobacteria)]